MWGLILIFKACRCGEFGVGLFLSVVKAAAWWVRGYLLSGGGL